jgi:tRNA(Ile)-lysidine synthase
MARRANVPFIATGHTADDQAETVLFRMLRGSGLRGLAGIPPLRRWRGVTIIRPMLHIRRAMVLDYLAARQQSFRTDSSNESLRFARNRIRQQLIPFLEREFSPLIVARLNTLADQAGQWDRALNLHVVRCLRRCELARSAALVILDVQKLANYSEFLLCEIGRHIWRREHWPQGDMSAAHWHRLAAAMRGAVSAVDFPGGISARHLPRVVRIGPGA